ncbi:MAG: uracil-DNA glycosylase [Rhodothermales bacterium]|nr:uracil-DNA glycosylase [Rhodothermales bacterium]
MLKQLFETVGAHLFDEPSTDDLFNPYSTRHPELDRPEAVDIRRDNFRRYVTERSRNPEVLLLAEAPGPWGCRFSGVPITSEAQLLDPDFPISGRQSSTAGEPHTEYSAGIYWRILLPWHDRIFTWNTVPFHPHSNGVDLDIRTPRVSEIRRFLPVTRAVVDGLEPRAVLAVGRKAERALGELGVDCTYVRHPSQGGAAKFERGVRDCLHNLGIEA